MPLLSYEGASSLFLLLPALCSLSYSVRRLLGVAGVEVDIPTSLNGIQFSFTNGSLTIRCSNFTGNVVLSKPAGRANDVFANFTTKSTTNSTSNTLKKRTIDLSEEDDEDDEGTGSSEQREVELQKRIRPNFLNDVEQSMLLAQLDVSQQSLNTDKCGKAAGDVDSIVLASSVSVPDEESNIHITTKIPAKPPAKTPAKKAKKGGSVTPNLFFSPEPKDPTQKPSPKSHGKRGRPKKTPVTSVKPISPTKTLRTVSAQWTEVKAKGTIPAERWGHSATKISDDRVVMYGGANDDEVTIGDLHVFDLKKLEWSQPLNCESIPRTWHDAVYLETKHLLLVFGGERITSPDQMEVLSDIMVLDTECFLWYPPAISGVAPVARSGHTCTVVGNEIVVFGGSRGRNRQSSVHVLDSDKWHWKTLKIEGKPPSARTYHSAVTVGNNIVYFGGNDSKQSFNSVHVLQKSTDSEDSWTWFHPCVIGQPPCPRTGHSATLIGGSSKKILIYGGWDPQQEEDMATSVFDDAFFLNTEKWEWERVILEKGAVNDDDKIQRLPGRVGHRAVLHEGNNQICLFGGQNGAEQRLNVIHAITLNKQQPEEEALTVDE